MYPLYKSCSWSLYKKAGADVILRGKYRNYLLLHVFLKMDCMVSLINILAFETNIIWPFYGINIFCAILSLIYYLVGRYAYVEEIQPLVISFWGLSLSSRYLKATDFIT